MRKPKHALWYSVNPPTEKQLEEIRRMGYYLVAVRRGMKLARTHPKSIRHAMAITIRLSTMANIFLATGIFGEFPPEILHLFYLYYRKVRTVLCFMPATYIANGEHQHREFVVVGSLPWLPRGRVDFSYREKEAYIRRYTIWRRKWRKIHQRFDLGPDEQPEEVDPSELQTLE